MKTRAGTSGYSYKEWKGNFYPADLPAAKMLQFYAERFSTVEINNTFYKMPNEKLLLGWAEQAPEGFVFVLKAPRRISHAKGLKDVADELAYFIRMAGVLGKKRGPLLFQLSPWSRKDVAVLQSFLELVPTDIQAAFEFRHQSWFDDEVFAALRAANAALCLADADSDLEVPFVSTAKWGYLRLRREDYTDKELRDWAKRVHAQGWQEAFVFFKHEDAGKGPELAGRFLEVAGK